MATQGTTYSPDLACIDLLAKMCFDPDPILAAQADQALYQTIILPLCDDFSSGGVHTVSRVLARLIEIVAHRDTSPLHSLLRQEKCFTAEQLLGRFERISTKPALPLSQQEQIKKICILSRVTIGADVCITSVILKRLHHHFPNATISLIGPDHLPQLFTFPYVHHITFISKGKNGLKRMENGFELFHIIKKIQGDVEDKQFLLIDPDSRLSQLGLLPLAPEQCTYILPSRMDQTRPASLTAITNSWLGDIFGTDQYIYPEIQTATTTETTKNASFTIVVNLGVGHDANKRISLVFEQQLMVALLDIGNVTFDSGLGTQELNQAKAIANYLDKQAPHPPPAHHFCRVEESVSELANQIHKAHLFIGYDSCSGHIATACETPAIIIFKGAPNPRFRQRWHPENKPNTTTCLDVSQKQVNETERCLLIRRIIDIASSHYQSFSETHLF